VGLPCLPRRQRSWKTNKTQKHIADATEIIERGSSVVGIVAPVLVDELMRLRGNQKSAIAKPCKRFYDSTLPALFMDKDFPNGVLQRNLSA
jgi:hypothetical protein